MRRFVSGSQTRRSTMHSAALCPSAAGVAVFLLSLLHSTSAQVCGGLVTSAPVTISSPNFPDSYTESKKCRWVIRAPPGENVRIEILNLSLGGGSDMLRIFHGVPVTCATSFTTFTSENSEEGSILQLGNRVTVAFSSGGSSSGAAFQLNVEFVLATDGDNSTSSTDLPDVTTTTPIPGCGGQLRGSGRMMSPGYPTAPYSPNTRCVWQLWPVAGRPVTLHIVNLRLESPWDTLRVYRSASPAANDVPTAEYTGTMSDVTRSFGGGIVITVVFTSDDSEQLSGFEAVFYSNASSPAPVLVPSLNLPLRGVCGIPATTGGIKAADENSRIVGGVTSQPNMWPWQVHLAYSGSFKCGGSLLTEDWVVTAAHCIGVPSITKQYALTLGKFNQYITEANQQRFTASKIVVHPEYKKATEESDIALIKLNRRATFTRAVRPVCLPESDAAAGIKCFATGWGDTHETGSDELLRQISIPILSRTCCKNILQGSFTKNMTCAGYLEGGKDTCQGDSGGPLVCKIDGVYYLYGITSWGDGCAEPLAPGVYTRVPGFVRWIKQTIAAN